MWRLCYAWVRLKSTNHLEHASHFLNFNLFDAPIVVNLAFGNIWIAMVSKI